MQPTADDHHHAMQRDFAWHVPATFNMAHACAVRWAQQPDAAARAAVIDQADLAQPATVLTYAALHAQAQQLAGVLQAQGVAVGERVAIVLPQRAHTAVAYVGTMGMGAVAMPLSQLFGADALRFRLQDSGAVAVLADRSTWPAVAAVLADCPTVRLALVLDGVPTPTQAKAMVCDWGEALASQRQPGQWVQTAADDPAVLIYTSGTTGNPKGALIPHRALLGNLTGFVCSQNWFGFDPARGTLHGPEGLPAEPAVPTVFWSPADWAWTGGLMDALLPTLYFGRPIVAHRGRFGAEVAFDLLQRHRVTHAFLFPTALKAMMKAQPLPKRRLTPHLQAIMSAGEALGDTVFGWCERALGVTPNEMFGQTEINYIVGNCAMNGKRHVVGWPARPGSMGKGYPGHRVAVLDEYNQPCPPGQPGEVAVHRLDVHGHPDPVFFLGYWRNPEATAAKYTGQWCRTGDMAVADEDGYLWYHGRADDMFKSAGYRIGPSEIENCLVAHPAVANAAVVPKPDAARGAVVKAYVVLAPEAQAQRQAAPDTLAWEQALREALQASVKDRLAPYEYPKEIEWIDALPMTTTGKVQRRVLREREAALAHNTRQQQ